MLSKIIFLCLAASSLAVPLGPNFWLRIGAACGLLLAFSLHQHRRAQRKHELERLRLRLAADLHDDIGANLSQITILAEVLRRQNEREQPQLAAALAPLTRISGETVDALSDIVWATNPQHDSLNNLARRMRRFASELLPAAQIDFTFTAPPHEPALRIEGELRRQIFLIFKESLNNIVRHAHCTQAAIELRVAGNDLRLHIRDNGRGFTVNQPSAGNGLPNLQRRAQTIGAELTINSLPGGTTIALRAPYRHTTQLQAALLWLCNAWQWLQTYLNRGVTSHLNSPTLPSSSVQAELDGASIEH